MKETTNTKNSKRKTVENEFPFVVVRVLVVVHPPGHCRGDQLQHFEVQLLLQLRKHLEYPPFLDIWDNYTGSSVCTLPSSPQATIRCDQGSLSELRIMGDHHLKLSSFHGSPLPNHTLSPAFSLDSFVTTLTRLSSLKVVSLVALGMTTCSWSLSPSLSRVITITTISLSKNHLSGKLPDLSSLTSLHVLDLIDNHFVSDLPNLSPAIVTLLLSRNSFSGSIQDQFGELKQLQHLDLSFNLLSGTPPATLFSLPNISYMDLSSNKLSGSLPHDVHCGSKLGFVDISNNMFIGNLPSCLSSSSAKPVVKFGGNCLSVDLNHQHHEGYCMRTSARRATGQGLEGVVLVAGIVGACLVMVLLAVTLLIICRRRRSKESFEENDLPKVVQDNGPAGLSSEFLTNVRLITEAAKLGNQGPPSYRLFRLEELKEATKNFDPSALLGEGSIGKLYKGRLENGTYVVIRSLVLLKKHSVQSLRIRLDLLSKLHHSHLVALLGHCIDRGHDNSSTRVLLVYEYMLNGNYRAHLSEDSLDKILKWSDRLAILIGVAKAIHFLHTGIIPSCYNNRLKTNNILLDEHHIAKLSDYGMSILTDEVENSEAKGEGLSAGQRSNLEDDVYNFGFIILESLVGPIVTGKGESFLLNEMASFGSHDGRKRIVDPVVLTTCSQESLSITISITSKCISPDASARPSFEDVLWNLQYAAQMQAAYDADQRSDATSQS
ncbi:hypothetical protein MLD38_001049 [Melastoma candidum]|uniref:Uncharacterized protein n=1 Tax=Melastoma candidum TaxID=119954 RepID=A0ACB9SCY3_9MYRT|nr:hypothetical protein MLD38_001049 [Melastoma candidum]